MSTFIVDVFKLSIDKKRKLTSFELQAENKADALEKAHVQSKEIDRFYSFLSVTEIGR